MTKVKCLLGVIGTNEKKAARRVDFRPIDFARDNFLSQNRAFMSRYKIDMG